MCAVKHPIAFPINKGFEIPSIPLVLIKIIQTLDADKSSAKELEELILHDPALSARILRLANSAFYCFRARVKTISHAITLLGMNLVTSLAIGINIFDTFTKGSKSEAAHINQLWTHSCGVAVLVKEIWSRRSRIEKEGEFAFLCGLLHDLGKVILFKTYPGHYSSIYAIAKTETDPSISSYESEYYGVDHAAIGEMLAKQWGFPSELVSLIRRHHDPLALSDPMVRAVTLSDMLAKEFKIGYDGDDGLYEDMSDFYLRLGVSEAEYEGLKEFASRERENIEGFFKFSS
ncbi:MAG: HDOD domain-containing protein [Acidobacteria bacterium]|nr:HDOD domain-containing protein [Acidobacteriota bacterium]